MTIYSKYKHFIWIGFIYFFGFLLLAPVGNLKPYGRPSGGYSLTKIDQWDDASYYIKVKTLMMNNHLDYRDEGLKQKFFYSSEGQYTTSLPILTPIGPSLLWAPFIVIGHVLTILLNKFFGLGLAADGYSTLYIAITCIGSSLYAFLSLLISYIVLTKYFKPPIAILAVITVFFGNTLFYNTYNRMAMAHATEAFSVALAILLFMKSRERAGLLDYMLLGLSYGLMGLIRFENMFLFSILPFIDLLHCALSCAKTGNWMLAAVKLRNYLLAAFLAFMVFSIQLVHFYIQTGEILPSYLKEMGSTVGTKDLRVWELLFSKTRNITWGQPVIILGALGTLFFMIRERFLGICLFLTVAIGILWLFFRPHVYWWGMDFGIRHLIKISLPLAFGYAALVDGSKFKGKSIAFIAISGGILIWEYLKYIQAGIITRILAEGFLSAAASKIWDVISNDFPAILSGRLGSFFNVLYNFMVSGGFAQENYKVVFFYALPIFLLIVTSAAIYFTVKLRQVFYTKSYFQIALVLISCSFCVMLSLGGLTFSESLVPKQLASASSYKGGEKDAVLFGKEVIFEIDVGTEVARKHLSSGWSVNEGPYPDIGFPTFVWATGKRAEIAFDGKAELSECILAFRATGLSDQVAKVEVNRVTVGGLAFQPGWHVYTLLLPAEMLREGNNEITFVLTKAKTPGSGKDKRELAAAFDWVAVYRVK